jgi:hypothetical protein
MSIPSGEEADTLERPGALGGDTGTLPDAFFVDGSIGEPPGVLAD